MTWGEVVHSWMNALIAVRSGARRIVRCGRGRSDQGSDRAARQGTPHARRAHEAAMIVIEHAGYVLTWFRELWINDMPWSGIRYRRAMIKLYERGVVDESALRAETSPETSAPRTEARGIMQAIKPPLMIRPVPGDEISAHVAIPASWGVSAAEASEALRAWGEVIQHAGERADEVIRNRRMGLCPGCGHNRHVHLGVGHPCGHAVAVDGIVTARCRCALAYVVGTHEVYTTVGHDRTVEPGAPWRDTVRTVDHLHEEDHSNPPGSPGPILCPDCGHAWHGARETCLWMDGQESMDVCRCHRQAWGRADEQVEIDTDLCAWCGHAGHEYGQPCAQSAAGRPGNLDGSPHMCGCVAWVGPEPEPVDGCPPPDRCAYCDHDDHDYGDGECHHMTRSSQWGTYRCACPGNRDSVTESPERPSPGLVVCEACGHPQHTPGDGLCAFLVSSQVPSGETVHAVCGCAAGTDRLVVLGDPIGACTVEPECPACDAGVCTEHGDVIEFVDYDENRRVITEHDPAYNDLQTYLEGGPVESVDAAKRLDQRGVDAGQISPKAFWDTWGELPRPSYDAHKIWCARWRQHQFEQCPVWGAE